MKSIWKQSTEMPSFAKLKGNVNTDVLIIGGGLAGILCAYKLSQNNIDYILVEADKIFNGVSANTTAKITSQHSLIYSKIIKEFNTETARRYLEINEWAIKEYRHLCQDIDCDFENKNSFVYSLNDIDVLKEELLALKSIGYKAEFCKQTELPLEVKGAIKFRNQAQFNPVKFISELSKGLNIFENTKVWEYDGTSFLTDYAKINAKHTIVATHFPIFNKHGLFPLKMFQDRSYAIAYKNTQELDGMYVDYRKDGLSFRTHKDYLIIGGGAHRTGKQGKNFKEIEEFVKNNYPKAEEITRWATQDCITLDSIPYIGMYSKSTPNLLVSTGFNKWGFTTAMAASEIIKDMIMGKQNKYSDIFSPSRSILRPQLLINSFETIKSLLTFTKPRCPHLGCALNWNPQEHSWDCSCHGSRFSEDGKLLNNPATDDIDI